MTDPNSIDKVQMQGCGNLLRLEREKAGLTVPDVASRLKVPARIVEAIEAEEWDQLGAPVFVRGQLRSYARLLGVDITQQLRQAHLDTVAPATLVSRSHTSRWQHFAENASRRAVYVVITAVLVVPVWMAAQSHWGRAPAPQVSLDVSPTPAQSAVQKDATSTSARQSKRPYVASIAPITRTESAEKEPESVLALRIDEDSWMQVVAPAGNIIEEGLLKAGEERRYAAGEVGRVVLGNAAGVVVQHAGSTVDTLPYRRANVARFAVSADGAVVPVAD